MSKKGKDKIEGKGVLVRGAVVCIVVAAISLSLISGLAAQGTEDTVNVIVNAPEYVEGTFDASIDVDNVTDFNSGQFDLTFNSNVVNVTEVANGSIDGETIPVDTWECMDEDTVRVFLNVSGIAGVNGSGNLATISFAVVGMGGDRSVLDISDGMLGNTKAEEIPAVWVGDEVIVGPVKVEVNAPEFAAVGGTFTATIDVVDDVANLNMALFDLSFDSSVVNVTDVANGSLAGTTIPVTSWDFIDSNTIKVMTELSEVTGVNGSGNLATISFAVVGLGGDRSVLDISDGMLGNTKAEEIPAVWVDGEVIVGPVRVEVNAPEMAKAEDTFVASIDVDSIANFNSGQFDLSFDSSVVNVTAVESGCIDETAIPIGKDKWRFMDNDTIRVLPEVPGTIGVSGSGNLATISFTVVGKGGDKSILDISKVILYNNEAEKIPAVWIDDEVIVGPVKVEVNAPEMVKAGETFAATVDVVDSVANLNIAQFDLSFNSSVVNVTGVTNGSIDGTEIPGEWEFVDSETIRGISELPEEVGVSGSGYLATISFAAKGEEGDESVLKIANGTLANNIAEEIPAEWIEDKVTLE